MSAEDWLTPKQLAAYFGLKAGSAKRWVADGTIEPRFIKRRSGRYIQINPAVVEQLKTIFAGGHRRTKRPRVAQS